MLLFTMENFTSKASMFVIAIIAYKLLRYAVSRLTLRLPPGPRTLPLIGHLGELSGPSLFHHKDTYGDISYIRMCGTDNIILNTADAIRDAFLKSHGAFDYRPKLFLNAYIPVENIVLSNPMDAFWKKQRQAIYTSMKVYGRGGDEIDRVINNELENLCAIYTASNGAPIQLLDTLGPSVCNIMYILLVGEKFPYDHDMVRKPLDMMRRFSSLNTPRIDTILRMLPVIPQLPRWISNFIQEIILDQKMIYSYIFDPYKNLPGDELQKMEGVTFSLIRKWQENHELTESSTKNAIMSIFAGGIDTTTSALYNFFLIMIHYPDVQRRIQTEIDDVVGPTLDRHVTLVDKPNMPYTVAAILELLRFATNVPMSVPHTSIRTASLRGFNIPRESHIRANFFRVHHDPDLWTEPWTYNPSRFLDVDGNLLPATHPNRRNLLQFSIGTRLCPGEVFAKTRFFMYVARLLQQFDFRSDDQIPSCDPRNATPGIITYPQRYTIRVVARRPHNTS